MAEYGGTEKEKMRVKIVSSFQSNELEVERKKEKNEWIMKTDVDIKMNSIEGQRACYNKLMCNTMNIEESNQKKNVKEKLSEQTNVTLVHTHTHSFTKLEPREIICWGTWHGMKTTLATPIWLLRCRYFDRKKEVIYEMCRPIIAWVCNFECC